MVKIALILEEFSLRVQFSFSVLQWFLRPHHSLEFWITIDLQIIKKKTMQLYSQDTLGKVLPKVVYCLSEMSPRKLSLREFHLHACLLFIPCNVLLKHSKLNPTWSAKCHRVKFIRTELIENTLHVFELFLGTMLTNASLGHNQNNVTHLTKLTLGILYCLAQFIVRYFLIPDWQNVNSAMLVLISVN